MAPAVCGRTLSWRRTISEDNILCRLFWIKKSNYSMHSTFGRTLYCFRMFTGSLRTQNWQVRCVVIDGHTRDIAQHICAKLHLILTVVLILRPIGPWKKIVLVVALSMWARGFEVAGYARGSLATGRISLVGQASTRSQTKCVSQRPIFPWSYPKFHSMMWIGSRVHSIMSWPIALLGFLLSSILSYMFKPLKHFLFIISSNDSNFSYF